MRTAIVNLERACINLILNYFFREIAHHVCDLTATCADPWIVGKLYDIRHLN